MSSPRATAKVLGARKARRRPAARPKVRATADAATAAQAVALADAVERGLAEGQSDVLSAEARQRLMAALCKAYAQDVQAGGVQSLPVQARSGVSATDVMITASGLLRAADLQVFELGMWQSWTGR